MENYRTGILTCFSMALIAMLACVSLDDLAQAQTQKVRISFSSRNNTSVS